MFQLLRQVLSSLPQNGSKRLSISASHWSGSLTKVSSVDGVRTITLSGPNRNALSLKMMEEVTHNITRDESDVSLRVIVINAEGPIFSSGHNLKELVSALVSITKKKNSNFEKSDSGKEIHQAVFKAASKMMLSILQSPVPVIASVHGLAAAAGCQLMAGCDIAVCSEKASFSTPGVSAGIFCSTPGVALVRAVPTKVASDMLFTGDPITAHQALQYGLVSRVVPEGTLDEEILKVTASIISKSRSVIELGKKFLYSQMHQDIYAAYRLGESIMVRNASMVDAQEGIRSFFEKKKPLWKHIPE